MKMRNVVHNIILSVVLFGGLFVFVINQATATGTATLSISPSSGNYKVGDTISVVIHENSGSSAINTVEADFSYNTSQLQYISSTLSSTFDFSPQNNHVNNLVCLAASKLVGSLTNDQVVATVKFKVLAAGTSNLSFISGPNSCNPGSPGSAIITQSGAQNIWNGQTTGGSFTLTAASSTPTPTPTTSSPSTNTSTSNSSTSTNRNNTSSSSSTSQSSNPTPTSTATSSSLTTSSSKGYLVAIKIVDSNGKALSGIKVTLDNGLTATSDKTGVASFANVSQGNHTAKAIVNGKNVSKLISVKGVNAAVVQQFELSNKSEGSPLTRYISIGIGALAAILLIAFGIWRLRRKHANEIVYGAPLPKEEIISNTPNVSNPGNIAHQIPNINNTGVVVGPTNVSSQETKDQNNNIVQG